MNLYLLSSLDNIYSSDRINADDLADFSMLKNERKSFQIVVDTPEAFTGELSISTDLEYVAVYAVREVPCQTPIIPESSDGYYRLSDNGLYPDLLVPVNPKSIDFKQGQNLFWAEVSSSQAGSYHIEVGVLTARKSVNAEVIDATLDFGEFVYTNWLHSDCLMSHYQLEAFSPEYWRIVENYIKTAARHGMNCLLTPIFTPALDTRVGAERPTVQLVEVTKTGGDYAFGFDNLTRWIHMAQRLGIKYFELSHFFTQWGAKAAPKIMATVDGKQQRIFGWDTPSDTQEYAAFLTAFSKALDEYLVNKNLKDKVFLHISDEPGMADLESYAKAAKLIYNLFDGYKIIDALSDISYYELGLISNPIPANDHIEPFLGKVQNLWTYYCCAQTGSYVSNRLFCFPSLRNRILGYQLFKFDIKGFLHWGYNFYYTQNSTAQINPYEVTDAGGAFPGGDSFVVYPADDGTAWESPRLKVFYDGLQDMAALNTLSKLVGKEEALRIIDKENTLTFRNYPHAPRWLLQTREAVNRAIKEAVAKA